MKVGLFIGNIKATDGGGFTYVSELLRAIGKIAHGVDLEFVVLHYGLQDVKVISAGLKTLDLLAEKRSVLSKKEIFFTNFRGSLERVWDSVVGGARSAPWEARVCDLHGIGFVLRLVPWCSMTMDIPFGAVIWDLQHRVNPWFPEVSSNGDWEKRETSFSRLCQRASLLFTGTKQGADEIQRFYCVPSERIKIAPFPTPRFALEGYQNKYDAGIVEKFALPRDFLFYPAQYWPHKNHVAVLEACRSVRERTGWDLGVVFVGSEKGNFEHVRDYANKMGAVDYTRFLGFVTLDELIQLYRRAFCLTFPTFTGPDNLPPLEAFALGCPVVASSVPGAEEQLGNAALLFPPSDAAVLADRIIELRETTGLRDRLITSGLQRAGRDTWEQYADVLVKSVSEFYAVRRAWR